jgi:aspartyl-tRNA(Asn)/glutamyl-tRNA(Gln) amidotransferase subunit C
VAVNLSALLESIPRLGRPGFRVFAQSEGFMSVDAATVKRIARLARIAVTEEEVPHLQGELNAILDFVAQLDEVDVTGVEPMTSVTPMVMKKRQDGVTDGGMADKIVLNAPATEDDYFLVPKVVE